MCDPGVSDFWREGVRQAVMRWVAVRDSGRACRALGERLGEKAAVKMEVCSWIGEEKEISGGPGGGE